MNTNQKVIAIFLYLIDGNKLNAGGFSISSYIDNVTTILYNGSTCGDCRYKNNKIASIHVANELIHLHSSTKSDIIIINEQKFSTESYDDIFQGTLLYPEFEELLRLNVNASLVLDIDCIDKLYNIILS